MTQQGVLIFVLVLAGCGGTGGRGFDARAGRDGARPLDGAGGSETSLPRDGALPTEQDGRRDATLDGLPADQAAADGSAAPDAPAPDAPAPDAPAPDAPAPDAAAPPDVGAPPDQAPPSGTRFAASSSNWPVPAHPTRTVGFDGVYGDEWTTLDLTGDGLPDLVWHGDDTSKVWGAATATPYWKVFKNNGSGFATSSTKWYVPKHPTLAAGFDTVYGGSSAKPWTTLDVDGDAKPDLVWYADDASNVWDATTATPYWKVFKNTGSRFATSSTKWYVPKHPTRTAGFDAVYSTGSAQQWTTLDLTGDARPDLVWYADDASNVWGATTTTPYWKVFKNSGTSFATSSSKWTIPKHPTLTAGFDEVFPAVTVPAIREWSILDLDGDARPDLVWYADDASNVWGATTTTPYWKVFKNSGTGFATSSSKWTIPKHPTRTAGFDIVYGGSSSLQQWTALDLTGDARPELVWYADDSSNVWGATTTTPYWKIFKNSGSGFATSSSKWTIPKHPTRTAGFDAVYSTSSAQQWTTLDLTGDARPDLVWYADDASVVWGVTASPYWKVFKNQP